MSCPKGMKKIIQHGGAKNRNIRIYNILKYVNHVLEESNLPHIDPDDIERCKMNSILHEFDWEPLWERCGD